ncbi:MAG: DUF3780 domain-containing protein [Gammaproteobacteria bacterium]|nr:DUF3780 domain-containing protein [Gammaproteobacteria bacterium]
MAAHSKVTYEGFGFCPRESAHHFVVNIPASNREDVAISEHFTFDAIEGRSPPTFGAGQNDGKLRSILARPKWGAIADELRVAFNRRLKAQGIKAGRWKTGINPVSRLLGKELTLLAWGIEEADPALIATAIKNWQGLVPEERWWLFTMTAAATGHAVHGRGHGWRKAIRYALTENPVTDAPHQPPPMFRLVARENEITAGRPDKRKRKSSGKIAS